MQDVGPRRTRPGRPERSRHRAESPLVTCKIGMCQRCLVAVELILAAGRDAEAPAPVPAAASTAAAAGRDRHDRHAARRSCRRLRLRGGAHAGARSTRRATGSRFDHAYAAAPITLTSHASLMTGRYPPGHGARHNGMRARSQDANAGRTLRGAPATATAAFVAAFPLDRRFGLIKGFQTYGDVMPRDAERPRRERAAGPPGRGRGARLARRRTARTKFFLWVHLFEPHAPYGNPADRRAGRARRHMTTTIAEADAQVGRLLDGLGRSARRRR